MHKRFTRVELFCKILNEQKSIVVFVQVVCDCLVARCGSCMIFVALPCLQTFWHVTTFILIFYWQGRKLGQKVSVKLSPIAISPEI